MADDNKNKENDFESTVESLFKGMDSFITSKTVVGDVIKIDEETVMLPLVDVSFGVGAGAFADSNKKKNNGAGGMGGKITPSSVIVLKNGEAKVMPVKTTDPVTKAMDMVPDFISKFKKYREEKKNSKENLDDTNDFDE